MRTDKIIWLAGLIILMCNGCRKESGLTLVVGTYTSGSSEGMYTYRLNVDDLTVTPLSKATIEHPSYLTVSPDAGFVYAVSESGGANAAVSAFAFDKERGTLSFLNKKQVDAGPCYIVLDSQHHVVATANYGGGSVSFIPITGDGSLGEPDNALRFHGKGMDSVRQTRPHLHCVALSPDNQALFATDLGTDRIYRIEIHPTGVERALPPMSTAEVFDTKLPSRSGPRHLVFNRKGSHAYLINELSGEVMVFTIDSGNNLKPVQTVLADTCYAGGSADIHFSPDETFLYVSTRLQGDGIVVFKVGANGELSRIGYHATGKHPRNFAITPDGKLMLVACKDAGMIQIFRIHPATGLLTDTGKHIAIDQPVCIRFVE